MPGTEIGGALTIAALVAITSFALERAVSPAARLGRRLLGRFGAAALAGAVLLAFVIVMVM